MISILSEYHIKQKKNQFLSVYRSIKMTNDRTKDELSEKRMFVLFLLSMQK